MPNILTAEQTEYRSANPPQIHMRIRLHTRYISDVSSVTLKTSFGETLLTLLVQKLLPPFSFFCSLVSSLRLPSTLASTHQRSLGFRTILSNFTDTARKQLNKFTRLF